MQKAMFSFGILPGQMTLGASASLSVSAAAPTGRGRRQQRGPLLVRRRRRRRRRLAVAGRVRPGAAAVERGQLAAQPLVVVVAREGLRMIMIQDFHEGTILTDFWPQHFCNLSFQGSKVGNRNFQITSKSESWSYISTK